MAASVAAAADILPVFHRRRHRPPSPDIPAMKTIRNILIPDSLILIRIIILIIIHIILN